MRERHCGKIGWREQRGECEVVEDREIGENLLRYVNKDGACTIAGTSGHESRMNGTEGDAAMGDPWEREKEQKQRGGASTSVRDRIKGR